MTTGQLNPTIRWRLPAGLILLSAVPVIAGAVRMTQLTGGQVTPDSARYFASPLPVVLHIVSVTVYCLLGAFQFVPALRRRPWHRTAGRLLVPCGLVAALSGLWMAVFYPRPDGDGDLLMVLRLVFGGLMVVSLVLGLTAVRRRDFLVHRAWMIRAYAVALGAGSQAVTTGIWVAIAGVPHGSTRALLLGAGWAINLAVAELLIIRRVHSRATVRETR